MPRNDSDERGSLVSLTEEQEEIGEDNRRHDPVRSHAHMQLREIHKNIFSSIHMRGEMDLLVHK